MLRALLEQGLESIFDATTAIIAWWAANSLRHHAVIVPSDVHRGDVAQPGLLLQQHVASILRRQHQATACQIASCDGAGCYG